ncbi:MAG: 23S rRNA (adenine(2030)-N(6))-methyltransferase RlmJ [Hyphomicrobiaceae bacterium]
MNYRHAFHAGNFADVLKHVALTRVLEHMKVKPAPFRVVDTHAGTGLYDLSGDAAQRTGEWHGGIGRLLAAPLTDTAAALLSPYLAAVRGLQPEGSAELQRYPGSPELVRRLLRADDVLVANELHPQDVEQLKSVVARDRRIKVMSLDGFTVLKAALPPKERRGIVLIDPPFEVPGEFQRLLVALEEAKARFATGTIIVWYPVKDRAAVAVFLAGVKEIGLSKVLLAELGVRASDAVRPGLSETGILVVNPPYTLESELRILLPVLRDAMADGPGARFRLEWLVAEAVRSR